MVCYGDEVCGVGRGSRVLRYKGSSPHPAHLISSAIPHRTKLKVERKKVQDITLFQPKMRDHRSHRLRALPFFINFIQTNTQGDARDTRTPVPTPKPRGQGGGFLGGASAFADSEMLPLRVFIFPKYQKNKNLTPKSFILFQKYGHQGFSLRFFCAVESINLIRFSWLTSLAPGS